MQPDPSAAAPAEPVLEIDARGLLCPLPVLRARKALLGLPGGTLVRLLADDPAAVLDVPHFCAEAGHAFLDDAAAPGGGRAYLIRRGTRDEQAPLG